MLNSFFQILFRSVESWLIYFVPVVLLVAAATRKIVRREGAPALVFVAVLIGWVARIFLDLPAPAFQSSRLPEALGIAQPDSSSLSNPLVTVRQDREVLRLEAPSEMAWILKGDERELSLDYGYIPHAYEKGQTNGADVIIELSDGTITRRIFQRSLLPRVRPVDQLPQFSRVILPPFTAGNQLKIKFDPGERNDNAWDWLFVGNVLFRRSSHFLPSQFPAFSRVPDTASSPLGYLYQKEGRSTFLQLDAPSRLEFHLHGGERHLEFSYGMLPGAYQRGGGSDGAEFRVELQQPNKPAEVLFDRVLQPAAVASDRGPQRLNLPVPSAQRGSRLVLVIGAGPAQNNAWDWTYVTRLTLNSSAP